MNLSFEEISCNLLYGPTLLCNVPVLDPLRRAMRARTNSHACMCPDPGRHVRHRIVLLLQVADDSKDLQVRTFSGEIDRRMDILRDNLQDISKRGQHEMIGSEESNMTEVWIILMARPTPPPPPPKPDDMKKCLFLYKVHVPATPLPFSIAPHPPRSEHSSCISPCTHL